MIHHRVILKSLGVLFILFSVALIIPVGVEYYYQDGQVKPYWVTILISTVLGLSLWCYGTRVPQTLLRSDGFILVVTAWVTLSACGAIPFYLGMQDLPVLDAFFESVSGLTTTGAELLYNIDDLSHSLRFYHQYLQFLGGLGIIVLAIAIMPMLGGGQHLLQLDAPGPVTERRLVPRISGTAQLLWLLYVGLTAVCALGYWCVGLSVFEAICEAFSTVSTGGFSIHDSSFAYYQTPGLSVIAMLFMLAGAISFNVHYMVWIRKEWREYFNHVETCALLKSIVLITVIVLSVLLFHQSIDWNWTSIESILFTTVAMLTTTGLKIVDFAYWPTFVPVLLVLCGVVGGCSGSTTGGIKMGRALLIRTEGLTALKQLIHPQAVLNSALNAKDHIRIQAEAMYGFLSVFVMFYCLLLMMFMATGYDFYTAFSAITACLSNVGVAIGQISEGYQELNVGAKSILIMAMIAGRLEIMVLFICCLPSFWRQQS